jgi:hypothetical protein
MGLFVSNGFLITHYPQPSTVWYKKDPGALSVYLVYRLSTADVRDRRNDFRGNQDAAVHLVSPYRNIRDRHVPRYLAEFEYRFNRRYDLAAMMPRLGYVAVRTPPMPYRLLKLAEDQP